MYTRQNGGAAYVLVIFAMIFAFSLAAAVFHLVSANTYVAKATIENSNAYEAAVSGAYYANNVLNGLLSRRRKALNEAVLTDILSRDVREISFYRADESDFFGGSFFLKNNMTGGMCLYHALFAQKSAQDIAPVITNPIEFTLTNATAAYKVSANIVLSVNSEFYITSEAKSAGSYAAESVSAYAYIARCGAEPFIEDYETASGAAGAYDFDSIRDKRAFLHYSGAIDFGGVRDGLGGYVIWQIELPDENCAWYALKKLRKL